MAAFNDIKSRCRRICARLYNFLRQQQSNVILILILITVKYLVYLGIAYVYIDAVLYGSWVNSDRIDWGLHRWCYKDKFYKTLKNASNDIARTVSSGTGVRTSGNITQCQVIQSGDQPTYYQYAGTFANAAGLLFYASVLFMIRIKNMHSFACCMCAVIFLFMPSLASTIALTTVGLHYKDDDRWKTSSPSLGRGFGAAASVTVLHAFLAVWLCVLWTRDKRNRVPSLKSLLPPPLRLPCHWTPGPWPRPVPSADSMSMDGKKKSIPFHAENSGTVSGTPGNPLCHQPVDPFSDDAFRDSLDHFDQCLPDRTGLSQSHASFNVPLRTTLHDSGTQFSATAFHEDCQETAPDCVPLLADGQR